jgi:hypothetical protein
MQDVRQTLKPPVSRCVATLHTQEWWLAST